MIEPSESLVQTAQQTLMEAWQQLSNFVFTIQLSYHLYYTGKTTMTSTFSLQQFKHFLFVKGLLAIVLAAPGVVSAAGSGTAGNNIKDTNYSYPTGAYFVSPDGKDSNSGKTPNSPWPVAKALDEAPSGSTIVFKGGTYRNINAKINKKLTLQAFPHEKPWLKGSVVVTGWVADGGIWRKDGWSYSFPQNMSDAYIDPNYPLAGYRDMVYINGVSLKQVASKAKVVPGTFYVDSTNNKLYIGNNPAGKTVEATAQEYAFRMWKNSTSNPSNTVVRGLGFAHYADEAISVGAPHVTLENNTFVWNGQDGVKFMSQIGTTLGVSTDAIVRGNTFRYNGAHGIWGGRVDRMLLEDNTISYNNVERFSTIWDAAGIKVIWTDNLIWRRNRVENNFAIGMWVDVSSTNATIVNNIVRSNESNGIMFEISDKAIIASNVVSDNASAGIMVYNASGARVYNNTLVNNTGNLAIRDTQRNNTKAAEIAAGITWIARNNVVKNNIFSNTTSGAHLQAGNCTTKEASHLMVSSADHNAYHRKPSSNSKSNITWSLGAAKCLVKYNSIDAFNSATGYEANGLAIDNVATNPFFVNEASGDYRLKPASPAIGRGAPLPADIASAVGLTPGVAVDLGALQSKAALAQ